MKLLFIFIILVYFSLIGYSQCNISSCKVDSSEYVKIDSAFKSMLNLNNRYLWQNKYLEKTLNDTCYLCRIKKYAFVFNLIFEKGLRLSERLPPPKVRDNSIIVGQIQKKPKKNRINIKNLFRLFIDIKFEYTKPYSDYGFTKVLLTPEQINYINNLVKFGSYSYPNTIKDVLLLNYRNITMQKVYDDYRYHLKHGNIDLGIDTINTYENNDQK